MSIASAYLTVAGIEVDLVYKDIRNLHIGVYPPVGRVRVAAPFRLGDEQVRLALVERLPWIKRERKRLEAAERQSQREMVTGESHYVEGRRYRMEIVERPGRSQIQLVGDRLVLLVPDGTPTVRRRELLNRWYREQLREALPYMIDNWEARMDVEVRRWTIRRMKTKWGSCNRDTGHILFNIELGKKHPRSLEYIVAHEMTHLLERGHGERFIRLMDEFMPDWRNRRDELNSSPLSHEDWPVGMSEA